MLAALLSSIAAATGLVVDKTALSRERISLKVFLPVVFILLFAFTAVLVPFQGQIDVSLALLPNTLFLFFLMIVLAIAWNVLFYQGIQKEKVHQHELMMMILPLITVLLAAVFYPEERDWRVFILAVVASIALVFAKGQKEHFFIDRTSYNTFLGVVLMATESIIIRELLFSFSPVALYAFRTLALAIFFMVYYRPAYSRVSRAHWWLIGWSALIGVIQMLARFYAYLDLGIIYTTLVTILAPVIVFLASWEILHEKIRPRVIFAALVVLICVTIATVFTFG